MIQEIVTSPVSNFRDIGDLTLHDFQSSNVPKIGCGKHIGYKQFSYFIDCVF